jgi:hypothetical protein
MRRHPIEVLPALAVSMLLVLALAIPASAGSAARPFKGSLSGEVSFVPVSLTQCPAGGVFWGGLQTVSSATGVVSHLGSTAMTSRHCTPSGEAINGGQMTLTSDSGDEVAIEYSGSAPFPIPGVTEVIVVHIDFVVVDGTGRFEGATGGGVITAHVVFQGFEDPSWPATWVWDGAMIGY